MAKNPNKTKTPYSGTLSESQSIQLRQSLKAMGYRVYSEYLSSLGWKDIRLTVLERDGGLCSMPSCHRRATQVHHTDYSLETMCGYDLSKLHSICRHCHEKIHDIDSIIPKSPRKQKQQRSRGFKETVRKCRCCTEGKLLNHHRICSSCMKTYEAVSQIIGSRNTSVAQGRSYSMKQPAG